MTENERSELFEQYFAVGSADGLNVWKQALSCGARLLEMITAQQTSVATWIAGESSFPEKDFADATRSELAAGVRALDRSATNVAAPSFAKAWAAGDVSPEHVDVLTKGLKRVSPARRQQLLDDTPRLVLLAGSSTPREFDQLVQRQIRRFDADDDEDRLARQRKATALKSWIDQHTGMWRLSGSFDGTVAKAAGTVSPK